MRYKAGKNLGCWLAVAMLVVLGGCRKWEATKPTPTKSAASGSAAVSSSPAKPVGELRLLCASSMRLVLEKITGDYEAKTGQKFLLDAGGSQALLTKLTVADHATDLFLPADSSYIELARAKDLLSESRAIATMRPVFVLRAEAVEDPAKKPTWDDVVSQKRKVSLTNPDSAAIGMLTKKELESTEAWKQLKELSIVQHANVSEVVGDLKIGAADGGLIWDVMLSQVPGAVVIEMPGLEKIVGKIEIGIAKGSKNPDDAMRFLEYLASEEGGLAEMRKAGFGPAPKAE